MRFQRAILESNQEKYLATQRTESIRIKQASVADLARVGHTLSRPWLRPFVEENNSSTVDNVGLNPSNVQELLNLRYPDHIMVRGPPYLQRWRKTPINIWVEKERPKSLIQPKTSPNTCIDRWSLWWARQREQRLPSIQSKQYMLHSLLWESACNLHWTKNLVRKSGRSQGGHMLSSSGPPAPWLKNCKKPDQTQKKKMKKETTTTSTTFEMKHWLPWFFCSWVWRWILDRSPVWELRKLKGVAVCFWIDWVWVGNERREGVTQIVGVSEVLEQFLQLGVFLVSSFPPFREREFERYRE